MSRKLFKNVLATLLALMYVACSVFTPKPAQNPADAAKEEEAVYSSLLGEEGMVLILKKTTTHISGNDPQQAMDSVKDGLKGITSDTISNFIDRNAQPSELSPEMNLGVNYILIDEDELASLTRQSNWGEAISQKYPGAHGYVMFSRVGFNRSLDQAVVYVGSVEGPLMGAGYYYLLVEENGEWNIKERIMVWIS